MMIESPLSISWLLLGTLAGISIYWLWTKTRWTFSINNNPPFPVRPWPYFGHLFMLFGNLRDKFKEWRETCGAIYSLSLNGQLNILVNDFKDIKEIWIKHADKIVNAQHSFGDEILNEMNRGIIAARDDNWKQQRTTSLSILRNFGMGKNLMAEKIQEEVTAITESLVSFKEKPQDVRLLLTIAVSNVICSVTVGKRFDYDDPSFTRLVVSIGTFLKYSLSMGFMAKFKHVLYLPGDLFNAVKWTRSALDINDGFSKPFVKKFKQEFNENEDPQNFITAYLKEMKKMQDKGQNTKLNVDNLVAIIRALFTAGTETTSTTILWCLLYMLHYPHVQKKVYQEIKAVVGTERSPNISDKPKLTYLNAMIMETQRMASLVPSGLQRELTSTFEYGGFTFPKGSVLWPVLDSVHHDKKIWGDPENFRPERFIDHNGALINREELIPFGIGRRACLGESLARMELFLFISAIFHRFKLEPADNSGELPTLKESYGITVVPQPFKLRFIDRKAV